MLSIVRADFSHLGGPEVMKVRFREVCTLSDVRVVNENTLADTEGLVIDYSG
jgi:hypothetical protein